MRTFFDQASVTNVIAQKLSLDPDRLNIWINRGTSGAFWQGSYVSDTCVDFALVKLSGEPITGEYYGMSVEIQVYVPNAPAYDDAGGGRRGAQG